MSRKIPYSSNVIIDLCEVQLDDTTGVMTAPSFVPPSPPAPIPPQAPPLDSILIAAAEKEAIKKRTDKRRLLACQIASTFVILAALTGGIVFGTYLHRTERILRNDYKCIYRNTTCTDETIIYFMVGIENKYEILPEYPDVNKCENVCCAYKYTRDKWYHCRLKDKIIINVSYTSKNWYVGLWFFLYVLWGGGLVALLVCVFCCAGNWVKT